MLIQRYIGHMYLTLKILDQYIMITMIMYTCQNDNNIWLLYTQTCTSWVIAKVKKVVVVEFQAFKFIDLAAGKAPVSYDNV